LSDPELEAACAIVAHKDVQPLRRAMFDRLVRQRPAVGAVVAAWDRVGAGRRAVALVGAVAAKSFLELGLPRSDADLLAVTAYDNEARQVAALARLVPELRVASIGMDPRAALTAWSRLPALARDAPLMRTYVAGGDFLVAARVASTIGYYRRLRPWLATTKTPAVLVSSDANPYAVALLAAARSLGRRTCFVTHGHVAEGPPPLDVDLALLDGPVVHEVYARAGPIRGRVVYKGSEGAVRTMRTDGLKRGIRTLGVVLSILVDWPRVGELVRQLRADVRPGRLILRLHPNRDMRDPGWARHVDAGIEVSDDGRSLVDDVTACDLVVAGNSSAHLTVLKLGVPTACVDALDDMGHDYYRFVAEGIVPEVHGGLDPARLVAFYEDPGWAARFARFDASYPDRQPECDRDVAAALRALCRPLRS
jgi:hypothetical protein